MGNWTIGYFALCYNLLCDTRVSIIIEDFMVLSDVVSIPKTNENFRLLYDTKGRFRLHSIRDDEAKVCILSDLTL